MFAVAVADGAISQWRQAKRRAGNKIQHYRHFTDRPLAFLTEAVFSFCIYE